MKKGHLDSNSIFQFLFLIPALLISCSNEHQQNSDVLNNQLKANRISNPLIKNLTNEPFSGIRGTYFADVDGDKKADAIAVNDNGVLVMKSNGDKLLPAEIFINIPFYGSIGTYFADIDGDGKADAIAVNDHRINNKITVRRSNGSSFLPNIDFTTGPFFGIRGTYFADVDGDGKADAIAVHNDGVKVRKSDGTKFLPDEIFINIPFYGSIGTFFADVDGDGKADAIAVNDYKINNKITARKSNGLYFEPNDHLTDESFFGEVRTMFADLNGDRKADALAINDEHVLIGKSTGKKLTAIDTVPINKFYYPESIFFADIDGDLSDEPILVTEKDIIVINL